MKKYLEKAKEFALKYKWYIAAGAAGVVVLVCAVTC